MTPGRASILVGTGVGLVYLWVALPTAYWADSPELTLAPFVLGNAHPPSFPSYALFTRIFMLLPVGSVPFRASLAAAFAGAVAAGLFFRGLSAWMNWPRFGTGPGSPGASPDSSRPETSSDAQELDGPASAVQTGALVLASCFWAFSPAFWISAARQEVYTLAAALSLGAVLATLAWGRTRDERWLMGAALLLGLNAANHSLLTLAVLAPIGLGVAWARGRAAAKLRAWRDTATFFILGLSCYLYLPIRSSRDPVIDWKQTEHWVGFFASLTKKDDAHYFYGSPHPLEQAGLLAQAAMQNLSPLVIVLAVLGIWPAFRRALPVALLTTALLVTHTALVAIGPAYAPDNPDSPGYLLLTYAGLAALAGWGTLRLGRALLARGALGRLAAPLLGSGLMWAYVATTLPRFPRPADDAARAFGVLHLDSAPLGSIAMVRSDAVAFSMEMVQALEGRRPDVTIVQRRGLNDSAYLEGLFEQHPELWKTAPGLTLPSPPEEAPSLGSQSRTLTLRGLDEARIMARLEAQAASIRQLLAGQLGQLPVVWELGSDSRWTGDWSVPRGPWQWIQPRETPRTLSQHGEVVATLGQLSRQFLSNGPPLDPRTAASVDVILFNLANSLSRKEPAPLTVQAEVWTRLARLRPDHEGMGINAATALVQAGRAAEAVQWSEALKNTMPDSPTLWRLHGWCLLQAGHRDEAMRWTRIARDRFPDDPELAAWARDLEQQPPIQGPPESSTPPESVGPGASSPGTTRGDQ